MGSDGIARRYCVQPARTSPGLGNRRRPLVNPEAGAREGVRQVHWRLSHKD
jgi:hypothetical protein